MLSDVLCPNCEKVMWNKETIEKEFYTYRKYKCLNAACIGNLNHQPSISGELEFHDKEIIGLKQAVIHTDGKIYYLTSSQEPEQTLLFLEEGSAPHQLMDVAYFPGFVLNKSLTFQAHKVVKKLLKILNYT